MVFKGLYVIENYIGKLSFSVFLFRLVIAVTYSLFLHYLWKKIKPSPFLQGLLLILGFMLFFLPKALIISILQLIDKALVLNQL